MPETDELKAGKELDRLVAEHFFGWSDFVDIPGYPITGMMPGHGIEDDRQPVPPYSTDIAAAWLIVEKFKNPAEWNWEWVWSVDIWWKGEKDKWEVYACEHDSSHTEYYIQNEDGPWPALCKLALKVAGVLPPTKGDTLGFFPWKRDDTGEYEDDQDEDSE